MQCNATYEALEKQGVAYETVDISLDAEARDYVVALGYLRERACSSLFVRTTHWSNSRPVDQALGRGRGTHRITNIPTAKRVRGQ